MIHFLELFFKKIGKDSSDDTLAYKDNAHEVILHTFSYFLKIATATYVGQRFPSLVEEASKNEFDYLVFV